MKKTVVRLLSLLLIFSLGLGIMPLSLAETLPAESGNGITYQGINLEAGGQKPLTKAETDYYTEICDILRKNRNKKQMTVTEGDKTKVYTLSGQGDAAGLQEAVYQGKKAEASSLSSVSNISFSNRSAGQSVSAPDAGSRSSSATNTMNMLKDWKEKKNSPTPVTFTAQQGGASGQKTDADSKAAVTDGAANKSVGTLVSNINAAVSVKDASAASFRELYNSSVDGGPVTITAEELLQYIELGDEMAIEFAESLGFGRSEKKQKENLSAMVEEYKTHSDYKEPAFIINGIMIGLDKEIQEDMENGGYRTDVSVNASASVSIVYDEKGEAKVMRRVPSDNPTDFLITLDVSGSMESNGRGTAMLSALEVLLDEILAKPENTATVIFWANNAAVMRLDIDQNQVIETFSGADGHTAQAIYASPLVNASGKQDSYGTTLGDYQALNDRIINRIESLYGTGGSTAPSKGLNEAIRLLEQMDQTQRENRNLGVLLFTDGAADSGSEELKTVENETALVEKYGAQIVNVGIGDEKQVDQYRRYLDPNSDTYRGGENELLQDRILYYNIPKLTNQELAERVAEMFSTAFSEMTTEMVQLKSETVTTGVLAAVKTKVIETIPAGFQVMRSGRTYTVEGTDENGNTIVSFDLGNLMAGNGKTVSYFTVPQEGKKDIGVTAYTSASGTSLYVEPVNRFHFMKYDPNGEVTKNERGVEIVYQEKTTLAKKIIYKAKTEIEIEEQKNQKEADYYSRLVILHELNKHPMTDGIIIDYLTNYLDDHILPTNNPELKLNQIEEIITTLRAAPKDYCELYLFSLMNYDMEVNGDRKKAGGEIDDGCYFQFPFEKEENFPNCLYMYKGNEPKYFSHTFFHESGHAIEISPIDSDLPSDTLFRNALMFPEIENKIQESLTNDVRRTIDIYLLDNHSDLNKAERNAVIDAFINGDMESEVKEKKWFTEKTIMLHQSVVNNDKLKKAYLDVKTNLKSDNPNCDKIDAIPYSNASMVEDLYGGVTNNKIFYGTGHPGKDDNGNYNYWYKDGEQNYYQLAEAWAEYFSAKIRNDTYNIKNNEAYFPTATLLLEQLAKEMREYYIDFYQNKYKDDIEAQRIDLYIEYDFSLFGIDSILPTGIDYNSNLV